MSHISTQRGEKILYSPQFHWVWFVPTVVRYVGIGAVLSVTSIWMWSVPYGLYLWPGAGALLLAYLFGAIWMASRSIIVLTNERIISIHHLGMFKEHCIEIGLDKIQHVQGEVHGILPTILRYGTLFINTANEEGEIEIPYIKNPIDAQEKILNIVCRYGNASARSLETPMQTKNPGGVHDLVHVLKRLVEPNRSEVQPARAELGFTVKDRHSSVDGDTVSPRFKKFITRALLHPSARDKIVDDIRSEIERKNRL